MSESIKVAPRSVRLKYKVGTITIRLKSIGVHSRTNTYVITSLISVNRLFLMPTPMPNPLNLNMFDDMPIMHNTTLTNDHISQLKLKLNPRPKVL